MQYSTSGPERAFLYMFLARETSQLTLRAPRETLPTHLNFFFQPRNQEFSKENGLQIVKIPLKRKGKAIWKDWEKSGTTLISSHQGEPKVPLHSVKYTSLSEASAALSSQHPIEYYLVWECTRERVLIGDRSGIAMKCDTSKRISRSLHLQAQNEF